MVYNETPLTGIRGPKLVLMCYIGYIWKSLLSNYEETQWDWIGPGELVSVDQSSVLSKSMLAAFIPGYFYA